MDLDLQGKIEKFTLTEIFQLVAASRKSGTLGIQKDDSIVMIYFRNGEVVYAYGPRQTFHLGKLLKERGILTAEQLEEAINTQAKVENSRRLGEILIRKGFIDRADLQAVVTDQIEELLYSLLSWQAGSFKFYENQFPTDEEITVKLSVENVILEGLRRLDEANMVKETLPNLDQVYTISATQGERTRNVSLEASEWNIMALVNGQNTVNEICELSHTDRDETLKQVAQLKLAGLITPTEKKERKERPGFSSDIEQMVNRLAGLFDDYLSEKTTNRLADRDITTTSVGDVN
jgi:predicted transcriptional regulator